MHSTVDHKGFSQQGDPFWADDAHEHETLKKHRQLLYNDGRYLTAIGFSESGACEWGMARAANVPSLNGDLNQNANGKDIYTCIARNPIFGPPITRIQLQESGHCPAGYRRAGQVLTLNGDLNQNAGGKDIYVCYSKLPDLGPPITDLIIVENVPPAGHGVHFTGGLNGDLNQNAGGKDIYFQIGFT